MFYILNFLYLSSVIACFVSYGIFSSLAKVRIDRYNKLMKQLDAKEYKTKENKLNIFENDENLSAVFNFIVFSFFPILNLFLFYTYITYIAFLRKE